MSHFSAINDIYSCSWGPSDNGKTLEAPNELTSSVLQSGTSLGRGAKGSIFVFASGNGGMTDGCNFDGYANSRYTIAVGALTFMGVKAPYQEVCSAQLVTMYSAGSGNYVVTRAVINRSQMLTFIVSIQLQSIIAVVRLAVMMILEALLLLLR